MNGLYEIHHTVAYRQMLIFFALAVIVTYRRTELFNWINLLYVILAAVVGRIYYTDAMAALEEPEELDYLVVKLTTWVGILFLHKSLIRLTITNPARIPTIGLTYSHP